MGSCLFHQKLQMLNCCIQHKKKRENSMTDITGAQAQSSKGSDSKTSRSESDTHDENYVTPNIRSHIIFIMSIMWKTVIQMTNSLKL